MSYLARKLASQALKRGKEIANLDASNPLTIDSVDFAVSIGKGILKITKEVLF